MDEPAVLVVVYAKNLSRVALFYEQMLGLDRAEASSNFVLLRGTEFELSIVQAPKRIAEKIEISDPPSPREETPIKLSFCVADIEAVRALIQELGGYLKAREAAWSWRGCVHLDGVDPEGNVFQLRQREG